MIKFLCLIDALGPGGAERQMTGLSTMLKQEGYEVEVCYFVPMHFFVDQIKERGVAVKYLESSTGKLSLIKQLRKECKAFKPDVVVSYLQTSSILASLLRLSGLKFKLIVSERNTNQTKSLRDIVRFNLFRIADYVVPNSYSQQEFIDTYFRFLSKKVKTIVNFVDTDKFSYIDRECGHNIVVAATIWPSKNTLGFIKALKILKDQNVKFHAKWFGKVPDQDKYIKQCEALIQELELNDCVELLDKTHSIVKEYYRANFFCLPSFYEGTPNVICEAMSTGLPVVCSYVCDNSRYIENGTNGYLFNPKQPEAIAAALKQGLSLTQDSYIQMSLANREKAEILLSKRKFIENYIKLIES